MFNLAAIDNHFPMRVNGAASYREGQRAAIEFTLDAFNNGKKIVILEGPTGSGKSPIGLTLADMVPKSYYLTATKVLQDQLVRDFPDVIELKGRNAYPCTFYTRFGPEMVRRGVWKQQQLDSFLEKRPDCNTGFCKSKTSKAAAGKNSQKCLKCFTVSGPGGRGRPNGDLTVLPPGMTYSACPYYEQVFRAMDGRKVLMNFSSFLYQTSMTRRFDEPRDMLIVDEAHNIENQLMDFISLTISDALLRDHGIIIPELATPLEYAVFFEDAKLLQVLSQVITKADEEEKHWLVEDLSRTVKKYKMFMDHVQQDGTEWVCEFERTRIESNRVTLKPVFVQKMAYPLLFRFATHVVLMSATILDVDVLCNSLGIDRSTVAAIRMKNRFPVDHRPIYVKPVAKMTGGQEGMKQWGPFLVEGVNEVVEKYRGKKGIIHTHNFAIQDLLYNKCIPAVRSRFLRQQDFENDKRRLLQVHAKMPDSIIVAPAMHEGIDLHGDLSRFQIICKVPYPNCFDNEQLARRVEIDRRYYIWLTALKLVQSYGRSVRSETDYADTYILDSSLERFVRDAKKMLPEWFLEALRPAT